MGNLVTNKSIWKCGDKWIKVFALKTGFWMIVQLLITDSLNYAQGYKIDLKNILWFCVKFKFSF